MIVNLTPHDIHVHIDNEDNTDIVTIKKGVKPARVEEQRTPLAVVDGVTIYKKKWLDIQNLPDPIPGTLYIVSGMVLEAAKLKGRTDCVAPDEFVRDANGVIVGCKGFWC